MDDSQWTPEQLAAITSGRGNLLLTASAGSGKTAVLTQRCLYLLTDAREKCNIDELLVLTFTDAAAVELRSRIGRELRRRCRNDSGLLRQVHLLDTASFSTIHAFCNNILREFFYLLGLDSSFDILDGDEAELLKVEIAEDVLENCYAGQSQGINAEIFQRFIQSYGAKGVDRPLVEVLVRLHNFMESLKNHQAWLDQWSRGIEQAMAVEDLPLVKRQKEIILAQLDRIISRLGYALRVSNKYSQDGLYEQHIKDDLLADLRSLETLLIDNRFSEALQKIKSLSFRKAPNRTKTSSNTNNPVKDLIDKAKKEFKALKEKFGADQDEALQQERQLTHFIDLLRNLQKEYSRRYQETKRRRNVLDFADLERFSLSLLLNEQGPTDVARQISNRYKYILVDEYQDISPIQDAILQALSRKPADKCGGNLFLVGDVKQSIYGFRQADPGIFLARYHSYLPYNECEDKESGSVSRKINLQKNFRSRRGIINGINFIFSRCMTKAFMGIDYRQEAQLQFGADYYNSNAADCQPEPAVEVHLIQRDIKKKTGGSASADNDTDTEDNLDELNTVRREAFVIARRIRQMVGVDHPEGKAEFDIWDKRLEKSRPVTFRDIVILLRSMKNQAEAWHEVFRQLDIPVHAELSSGYFVAMEIQDMLCLLKLLDNPRQDIPLATLLRSSLVGLNESQLAMIRLSCPEGGFYEATYNYSQKGQDRKLQESLAEFFRKLDSWRRQANQGKLAELIWRIYRDTNLLACVSGMPDGRQRYTNLLHLHDLARRFDSFSRQGLGQFLRFIEKIREKEGDFGPAPILSETDNVVRIMSIHRSKGLEFPVVIAAGLAKKFNLREANEAILFYNSTSRETVCPMGMQAVAPLSKNRWDTLAHNIVAHDITGEAIKEEMRILYVALTRAREKLLLVASEKLEQRRQEWQHWRFYHKELPLFALGSAKTAMDWLGPALASGEQMRVFFEPGKPASKEPGISDTDSSGGNAPARAALANPAKDESLRVKVYDRDIMQKHLTESAILREQTEGISLPDMVPLPGEPVSEECRNVLDRINWQYPYKSHTHVQARFNVTDLKYLLAEEQDPEFASFTLPDVVSSAPGDDQPSGIFSHQPAFLSARQTARATDIGTWTHLVLQRLDLSKPMDEAGIHRQIALLIEQNHLTEQQGRLIKVNNIVRLFDSELGRQIIRHKDSLYREWSFTMAVPAEYIYRQMANSDNCTAPDDPVLIRGVIDCLFATEQGMIVIDYKTDNITAAECARRAKTYTMPMQLYQKAVVSILHKPVARTMLYFLEPGVSVAVDKIAIDKYIPPAERFSPKDS